MILAIYALLIQRALLFASREARQIILQLLPARTAMPPNDDQLLMAYANASRLASRHHFYASRARQKGQADIAKLLTAMARSEEIQARRLLNTVRGQLDLSDSFLHTIFQEEMTELVSLYQDLEQHGKESGKRTTTVVADQLRRAQKRNIAFYDKTEQLPRPSNSYHICCFCGYVSDRGALERCPVCTAESSAFEEV